jgi:hypothetical protein
VAGLLRDVERAGQGHLLLAERPEPDRPGAGRLHRGRRDRDDLVLRRHVAGGAPRRGRGRGPRGRATHGHPRPDHRRDRRHRPSGGSTCTRRSPRSPPDRPTRPGPPSPPAARPRRSRPAGRSDRPAPPP